jgi:hypothetical protein
MTGTRKGGADASDERIPFKSPLVYQLKVTLKGAKPPIWRRLLITDDITLRRLHNMLQVACGWSNSHLHAFKVGRVSYGRTDPEWPSDLRSDARKRLDSLGLVEKDKLEYVYDFGDWWEHTILVEATWTVLRPRFRVGGGAIAGRYGLRRGYVTLFRLRGSGIDTPSARHQRMWSSKAASSFSRASVSVEPNA